ncbi:hypothetical protein SFRURICE_016919 [Spodoptera frugiperda]|nr:hypothetical protein SFRURICE_016919 [Spodoptera frugiperda]
MYIQGLVGRRLAARRACTDLSAALSSVKAPNSTPYWTPQEADYSNSSSAVAGSDIRHYRNRHWSGRRDLTPPAGDVETTRVQLLGRKPARHDHLAWTDDPPFLRELYSLFPKTVSTEKLCCVTHSSNNSIFR